MVLVIKKMLFTEIKFSNRSLLDEIGNLVVNKYLDFYVRKRSYCSEFYVPVNN